MRPWVVVLNERFHAISNTHTTIHLTQAISIHSQTWTILAERCRVHTHTQRTHSMSDELNIIQISCNVGMMIVQCVEHSLCLSVASPSRTHTYMAMCVIHAGLHGISFISCVRTIQTHGFGLALCVYAHCARTWREWQTERERTYSTFCSVLNVQCTLDGDWRKVGSTKKVWEKEWRRNEGEFHINDERSPSNHEIPATRTIQCNYLSGLSFISVSTSVERRRQSHISVRSNASSVNLSLKVIISWIGNKYNYRKLTQL